MKQEKLNEILEKHKLWLSGKDGGERAILRSADLSYNDLSFSILRFADLSYADLSFSSLRSADLSFTNLSFSNLRYTDLSYTDLRYADLSYTNLEDVLLRSAIGNMKNIKSIFVEQYPINYTENILEIGCERHLISDWKEFSDETILRMDGKDALKFWKKYKELIFKFIELSPATPTS